MKGRPRPSWFVRTFLRVPPMLYHVGLADRLARRGIMLLETTGRRSGRKRVAGLNFVRIGRTLYVAAGWGTETGWYQNLLASPKAVACVGDERIAVCARLVIDAREHDAVVGKLSALTTGGPPRPIRPLLKRLGFDFDSEVAQAFADPSELMLVAMEEV